MKTVVNSFSILSIFLQVVLLVMAILISAPFFIKWHAIHFISFPLLFLGCLQVGDAFIRGLYHLHSDSTIMLYFLGAVTYLVLLYLGINELGEQVAQWSGIDKKQINGIFVGFLPMIAAYFYLQIVFEITSGDTENVKDEKLDLV